MILFWQKGWALFSGWKLALSIIPKLYIFYKFRFNKTAKFLRVEENNANDNANFHLTMNNYANLTIVESAIFLIH